jgi:hypothetical protein
MWNWISNNPLETIAICIVMFVVLLALNIWVDSRRLRGGQTRPQQSAKREVTKTEPYTSLSGLSRYDPGNIAIRYAHRSGQKRRRKLERRRGH